LAWTEGQCKEFGEKGNLGFLFSKYAPKIRPGHAFSRERRPQARKLSLLRRIPKPRDWLRGLSINQQKSSGVA